MNIPTIPRRFKNVMPEKRILFTAGNMALCFRPSGSSQLTTLTKQAGFNELLGLRLIDTILEKGMHVVKKIADPTDKRASRAVLTPKGETLNRLLTAQAELSPIERMKCEKMVMVDA